MATGFAVSRVEKFRECNVTIIEHDRNLYFLGSEVVAALGGRDPFTASAIVYENPSLFRDGITQLAATHQHLMQIRMAMDKSKLVKRMPSMEGGLILTAEGVNRLSLLMKEERRKEFRGWFYGVAARAIVRMERRRHSASPKIWGEMYYVRNIDLSYSYCEVLADSAEDAIMKVAHGIDSVLPRISIEESDGKYGVWYDLGDDEEVEEVYEVVNGRPRKVDARCYL